MLLTQKHRDQITGAFCIFFYVLMLHKLWNGFLLFQIEPQLYSTRFDLSTWLLMNTGVHQLLLNNRTALLTFDLVFYSLPLIYWLVYKRSIRAASFVAVAMLVFNFIYLQCYSLYPANSIESFTAWMVFPLLLMTTTLPGFYFVLKSIRYFFLFFFFSSGVWIIIQVGLFNIAQM